MGAEEESVGGTQDVTLYSDETLQDQNDAMKNDEPFSGDDILQEVAGLFKDVTVSQLPSVNRKLDFSILHVPEMPGQRRFNVLRCRTRQNICRSDMVQIVDITFEFFNQVSAEQPAYVIADMASTGMMSFDAMKLAAASLRAKREILQTRNVATIFRFERSNTFFCSSLWRIFSELYKPVRPVFLYRAAGDAARQVSGMEEVAMQSGSFFHLP